MAKEKTPEQKLVSEATRTTPAPTSQPRNKGKGKRNGQPRIGGTAVPGAKSTLPKPVSTSSNPQQQQQDYSNRLMRRQMEHKGLGPQSETERMQEAQEKRKKKIERKKQRVEEKRQEIRRSLPSSGFKLGNKNLYFIIGTAVAVILLIVIFLIIRHPF
jgi:cobalamin biosynthesis Mg chelatase CobN